MRKLLLLSVGITAAVLGQTTFVTGNRVIQGTINFCAEQSATGAAYTCSNPTGGTISALVSGMEFSFKASHASSGASTLSVDGQQAPLKKNTTQDLAASDIALGELVYAMYDGTNWQLESPSPTVTTVNYNPAFPNANQSASSNVVVIGDSHMAGYLQTTSIPAQIQTTEPATVTDIAVSGCKLCAYWADKGAHEAQIDAYYNPLARTNILVIEGGGNDMIDNNTGTPAVPWITPQQVYDCKVAFAKRRRAVGWSIVAYPMYSRSQVGINGQTGDQLHDQLNALETAGWRSWADSYMVPTDPPSVFSDGDNSGSCFQSDHIHVVDACTGALATMLSNAVNQADYGTGKGAVTGGSIAGPLTVNMVTAGYAETLKQSLANDYAQLAFINDKSQTFSLGLGGSTSGQSGNFFLFNQTASKFPIIVNQNGQTTLANNNAGSALTITNSTLTDFAGILLQGDNSTFLTATGNSQSAYPGHYVLYDTKFGTRLDCAPTGGTCIANGPWSFNQPTSSQTSTTTNINDAYNTTDGSMQFFISSVGFGMNDIKNAGQTAWFYDKTARHFEMDFPRVHGNAQVNCTAAEDGTLSFTFGNTTGTHSHLYVCASDGTAYANRQIY